MTDRHTDGRTDRHIDAEVLHPLEQRQMETASFKAMEQPKTPLSYFDADGGFVLSPYGKITWNSSVSDDVVGGGCSEAMASGTYKLHSIFTGVSGCFFGFFGKARVMIMYHHTIEHDLIFCCFMVRFFFGAASTLKPTNAANACNMMPGSSVNLVRFKC